MREGNFTQIITIRRQRSVKPSCYYLENKNNVIKRIIVIRRLNPTQKENYG